MELNKEPKFVFAGNDDGIYQAEPIFISDENGVFAEREESIADLAFYEIDNCFLALTDEEFYKKFKTNIDEDSFGDADELLGSFKKLVFLFQSLGYQFTAEEKNRIFDLININITSRSNLSSEDIITINSIYVYLKILSDPEYYKKYLGLNGKESINCVSKDYCEGHLFSELRRYKIYPGHFSSLSSDKINRFSLLSKLENGDYAFIPDIVELDSDFENKIMANFPTYLVDDEDIAREIYSRLNKMVEFIPRQYTEGFDDNEFYDYLENLSSKDINLNNLGVTCGVWCDLYFQLLHKYTNLKTFICGKKDLVAYHRYVVILPQDGRVICADGTNVIYDKRNKTNMCDITRAKLGLSYANFGDFDKLKKDDRFSFSSINDEYDHDMEMYRIVQLIGSSEAKELMQNVLYGDVDDLLLGKFKVICQLIFENRDIDNVSLHSLCKNLLHICFNSDERKIIRFNDLYTKELADYPYVMSFSIVQDDNTYLQYIFDTNDGFHNITCDELNGLLLTGRLIKTDSNDRIMGIDSFPTLKK